MRWVIVSLACFAGGFLTHGALLKLEEAPEAVCASPAEVLELRLRVVALETTILNLRLKQMELFAQALELEESCGARRKLAPSPW